MDVDYINIQMAINILDNGNYKIFMEKVVYSNKLGVYIFHSN